MVVNIADEKQMGTMASTRRCCKYLFLLICVILISCASSFLFIEYYYRFSPLETGLKNVGCRYCDVEDVNVDADRNVKCCEKKENDSVVPIPERQIQPGPDTKTRTGAQLKVNAALLHGFHPKLQWLHQGSDAYIDGINHVIHHSAERNQSYDCLEITRNDRYLISIQITFRYWPDRPSKAVETYFTLTRFRNNEKLLVAKSSFMVPAPSQRRRKLEKQPRSLVRSDLLQKGDRLCVTVSRPDLVYASTIDNFFGIVSL